MKPKLGVHWSEIAVRFKIIRFVFFPYFYPIVLIKFELFFLTFYRLLDKKTINFSVLKIYFKFLALFASVC